MSSFTNLQNAGTVHQNYTSRSNGGRNTPILLEHQKDDLEISDEDGEKGGVMTDSRGSATNHRNGETDRCYKSIKLITLISVTERVRRGES